MAFRGNSDATGNGWGVALYDTAAEILAMSAAQKDQQKAGNFAQCLEFNDRMYVLVGVVGARAWFQITLT